MTDLYRLGQELRELLGGLLGLGKPTEEAPAAKAAAAEARGLRPFEDNLFYGELNRFSGSGGEVLVKGPNNAGAPATRIDVGDRLIGIGVTHIVETLSRPPGPESFRAMHKESGSVTKFALRAFQVAQKVPGANGFDFGLAPLTPDEFSDLTERVSGGAVRIAPNTIPAGTMILSFLDAAPTYTLKSVAGSPGVNWSAATKGERHWNVGIESPSDFWAASLPSDDIGALALMPSWMTIGTITFGLSLLPQSKGMTNFRPVPCVGPTGTTTTHHFCLSGAATGTQGFDTPFPIGLRTQIIFQPER
ncbi:MAG: hypothetical protein IT373_06915 [Polyangiaceae bacterium]|nr:hypothetical protein [Polyangiaceae bacterium]